MSDPLSEQITRDGYVVIRGLIARDDIAFYIARLKAIAGDQARWTLPDGVNRHDEFWPVIFNERLVAVVRAILGPEACYLPHNDLHLGFSSFSWHRDSVNRGVEGADWDESREPYRIVRVGIYLQQAESQFRLGLVSGSHRRDELEGVKQRRVLRRTGAVASVVNGLSGIDLLGEDADWVSTNPGDCVIFDPRVLHTGSRFHGEKYAIFVAYGVPNGHFRRHWNYYLHLRKDLGYRPMPAGLAARLQAAGLLADEPTEERIEGAWLPSATFAYVARRFK